MGHGLCDGDCSGNIRHQFESCQGRGSENLVVRYKGLYSLGRWAMGFAMAIALAISVISLRVAKEGVQRISWFVIEAKVEARLDPALVLFILLILLFLSRYPIRLNRNGVVHTVVY